MLAVLISLLNTAFWFALHFGIAYLLSLLPDKAQLKLYDYNRPYFRVSEKETRRLSRLKVPLWKDRLPQFNALFDKRHIGEVSAEHIKEFITVTCQAEIIHLSIAVLGFLSLLFPVIFNDMDLFPMYLGIAIFIGLCQIPFVLIQRYNRPRLLRVLKRLTLTPIDKIEQS